MRGWILRTVVAGLLITSLSTFLLRAARGEELSGGAAVETSDLDTTIGVAQEIAFEFDELQPPASTPSTRAVDDPPARPSRSRRTSRSRTRSRRSYDLLASVPNMFGDFYGNAAGFVQMNRFQPFPQIYRDGNPFDLFVENPDGPGANVDPLIPITIFQGGPPSSGGVPLSMSIGPGEDTNMDNQPDSYPISEPNGSAPPNSLGYLGGTAFFPGGNAVGNGDDWVLQFAHAIPQNATMGVLLPPGGGAVRRIKIAENNSPQPRCRLFYNYNFFNDVIGGIGDVNRHTFGYERTFGLFGVDSSVELRLPFAGTLASEQVANGGQLRNTQFGNLSVILKSVMWQNDTDLISAGLGIAAPTGEDSRLFLPNGAQILEWDSESVHLLPFVAGMFFRDRYFGQAFLQFDVDANGSRVAGNAIGGPLNQFGVLQDAALMFLDVGGGAVVYDNPCSAGPQMVSAIAELHYSTTLQDTDFAVGEGFFVGSFTQRYDVLNLSVGASIQWNNIAIRPAMAIPLRDYDDEQFDYEAMLQVNISL